MSNPNSTRHVLAQVDAVKAEADATMGRYRKQFGDMTAQAHRWLETVMGDTSRNPDNLDPMSMNFPLPRDPAQEHDRQEEEAEREEAGE
jgi:hypothetical protein